MPSSSAASHESSDISAYSLGGSQRNLCPHQNESPKARGRKLGSWSETETYRGKASGHFKLSKQCGFCDHKKKCWPELKVLPSKVYQGKKMAPDVEYVHLANQGML